MNPILSILTSMSFLGITAFGQQPPAGPPGEPGGPGREGGPMDAEERNLLASFDKDQNGLLDQGERAAARAFLKENPSPQGARSFGRGRGGNEPEAPAVAVAGAKLSPADVPKEANPALYATHTLRTIFFDFENGDWESELEDFHDTDVEVPAKMTVDGKEYPGVGVHFRGMSSYRMARSGQKRSLAVSVDLSEKGLRLDGYKTLNLNNSFGDPSFLGAMLYSEIARKYIPAPKVNLVRVVINGEDWGIYVNQQQFNKDFVQENYRTGKGARWKVPGRPGARSGLEYTGEDLAAYQRVYEMKSGSEEDWKALVQLCKTLAETPPDKLEAALEPILDIDGALWFLALDCALVNSDGYWTRASDYSLYRDKDGKFHVIPHDFNEAMLLGGGPAGMRGPREGFGGRNGGAGAPSEGDRPPVPEGADRTRGAAGGGRPGGGPSAGNATLDPLVGMEDAAKPLRSKLLAVPSLRERYLKNVGTIAHDDLDWKVLGPKVAAYRARIAEPLAADRRKNGTYEAFERLTADQPAEEASEPGGRGAGGMPLRTFAEQRRSYLLAYPGTRAEGS